MPNTPKYRFRGNVEPKPGIRASVLEPESDGDGVAVMRLYDPIDSWGGLWGVSAKEFAQSLQSLPDDTTELRLHLNSPGGEVFEAVTILNLLRQHKARVVAYVDGLAASAASMLAAGADELVMGRNSTLMVHDAWGLVIGNAADMHAMAGTLDKLSDNIASVYAEKAGGTTQEWRDVMRAETWMTAQEAVDAKLADRIDTQTTTDDEAKNRFDLSLFNHSGRDQAPDPTEILPRRSQFAPAARAANGTGRPEPVLTAQQWADVAALAASPQPPAEPVEPTPTKEGADTMSDTLIKGLRERLGVAADADLDEAGLLAAVDQALEERAEPTFTPPEGTVLMDKAQLDDLRNAAEEGRAARAEQVKARRESLVKAAIADGRIAPAREEHWLAQLDADEEGASQVLASLAKGTIPLESKGYTGGVDESSDEDALYSKAWGVPGSDKED